MSTTPDAASPTDPDPALPPLPPGVKPSHRLPILVVPAAELDRLGRFQGFSPDAERYLSVLLAPPHAQFRPRYLMEEDRAFKQIIPYVIFRHADSVFCYTRGSSQGESRLHAQRSFGVGGHVDEADADGRATRDAYELALRRELEEEVELGSPGTLRLVGLINDDATPVGQVHLGVVHVYELERPLVSPRELGLAEAGFVPLAELGRDRDRLESWSRLCLEGLLDPAGS